MEAINTIAKKSVIATMSCRVDIHTYSNNKFQAIYVNVNKHTKKRGGKKGTSAGRKTSHSILQGAHMKSS